MHSRAAGHEIPVSAGAGLSPSGWATHVRPPSTVASTTVAGAAGADVDVVDDDGAPTGAAGVAAVPGVPTAQQSRAVAHETASSCPVPAGAGCPTTSGVPDFWPSTGGVPALFGGVFVVQAATAIPSVTSTTPPRQVPVSRARQGRREGLQGTGGGQ
jgi:hypothetical protein